MKVLIQNEPLFMRAVLSGGEALDAFNAALVRQELTPRLEAGRTLLLHLGSVPSIDSAGVGALVAILKAVRSSNGRMALVDVRPQVRSVLDIIRLTTVFEIFSSDEEAIAALTASAGGS